MHISALIVPRGAEYQAVRRGWSTGHPTFLPVAAGAADTSNLFGALSVAGIDTALVLGLCGALDPSLRVGESVVYNQVINAGTTLDPDPQLTQACALALQAPCVSAAHVAAVIGSVKEKAALRRVTGASVIDMEAASIAQFLRARAIRFAMVRVVSDDANRELPDLRAVHDHRGRLQGHMLALAFARTPKRSIRFIADAIASLEQLRRTAEQLSHF